MATMEELQQKCSQLEKENAELKSKLKTYESLFQVPEPTCARTEISYNKEMIVQYIEKYVINIVSQMPTIHNTITGKHICNITNKSPKDAAVLLVEFCNKHNLWSEFKFALEREKLQYVNNYIL